MTTSDLVARTRARLAARDRRMVVGGPLIKAAVLLPILDRSEPWLVFAKRTTTVAQHAGQISFPGGRVDPRDAGFLEAALREAHEEVGLPPEQVEPLGALDDQETIATQFIITPWVGLVREPVAWKPDGHEIERVIEVPVAALLDRANTRTGQWTRDGVTREVYFYQYAGETIWGATARILRDYLAIVTAP